MNYKAYLTMIALTMSIGMTQTTGVFGWNWQNPIPSDNGFQCCHALDSNTLIIGDYEAPIIYKTTDGGLSWDLKDMSHLIPPPSNYNTWWFKAMDFPTQNIGYIITPDTFVLKTTDKGETWNRIGSFGSYYSFYDVDFPPGNFQVGYIAGIISGSPIILKTTNGGIGWISQTTPISNRVLWAVHFPVNADTGYVVGGGTYYDTLGVLLKTTNGGQNWVELTSPNPAYAYRSVFFCNNNIGYASGGIATSLNWRGIIIKTTNGGTNWQVVYNNAGEFVTGLYFLTPSLGFAFVIPAGGGTYSSVIKRTTDGGVSWTSIVPPQRCSHYYNFEFSFATQQIGYGVGSDYNINFQNGRIFKTTDGGTSWFSIRKGPTYANLYAVDFPENDQTGYVVGDSGCVLKTTNGGATWIRQFTGTGLRFRDVDFVNNQIGFAVGENGIFFKTTDGGNNWIPKNSTTQARLYAVKFVNSQVGYIGGILISPPSYPGVLLKTTDGGDTWTSQTIPNNIDERAIQDLFFFNADTGYAVSGAREEYGGGVALVYKTTNGGQNWVVNYSPPQQQAKDLYAIDFPVNSQVGYIAGMIENGQAYKVKFLKTTNGGSSWQQIVNNVDNSTSRIEALSFRDNFIGYAAPSRSEYNNMYKTTAGGTTWMKHSVPTRHVINDLLAIRNTDIVYAVGAGGMILKTTNGGSVWIEEEEKDEKLDVRNENGVLKVYPNPFYNQCVIKFQFATNLQSEINSKVASIKIFDISGRLVRSFSLTTDYCLRNNLMWSGDDDAGRRLPAGVYFIKLQAGDFGRMKKVILLE